MSTSCTDRKHPYYEQVNSLRPEDSVKFFTGENSYRMAHVSLGETLDFTSYGGMNYVVWKMNNRDLVKFVQTWMENQAPKIEYERIPPEGNVYQLKEKSKEFSYVWNRFSD